MSFPLKKSFDSKNKLEKVQPSGYTKILHQLPKLQSFEVGFPVGYLWDYVGGGPRKGQSALQNTKTLWEKKGANHSGQIIFTVDGSEIRRSPPGMVLNPCK